MSENISLKHIGLLERDENVNDWWRSQNLPIPFFNNKSLPFILMFDIGSNIQLKENIETAISNFLQLNNDYRNSISDLVVNNYKQMVETANIEPLDVKDNTDIWKYVHPTDIYINQRTGTDNDIYIIVGCECDWEEEHGLQLVFKNGIKITRLSDQDGHLTNSDAYDTPDSEDELLAAF